MLKVVDPHVANVGTLAGISFQVGQLVLVDLLEEEGLRVQVQAWCVRTIYRLGGRLKHVRLR